MDRAEVGGDFLFEVAGQVAQRFAGFDGGAHKADAFGFAAFKACDGKRYGKECLAGTCGALCKNDVVFFDCLDQFRLSGSLCGDADAEPVPEDGAIGNGLGDVCFFGPEHAFELVRVQDFTIACRNFQLVEDCKHA